MAQEPVDEKQQAVAFEHRLSHMLDDNVAKSSFWKRLKLFFTKPSDAQKISQRAFGGEFFSLALRTISPLAALHKTALLGTFGLSQTSSVVNSINEAANWDSRNTIYLNTFNSLANEITQTLPEVEWEMKSGNLGKNIDYIASAMPEYVRSRSQKYLSALGVAVSGIALGALSPGLLALGIPAYFLGKYISDRRARIDKIIFPHKYKARMAVNDELRKTTKNPGLHFATNDRNSQSQRLALAQKDLQEVSQYRQEKRKPLIWLSALATTALTGVALATAWISPLALIGIYTATNAFLGSIQSWTMASHNQKEIINDMMRNYNEIKHQPELTLKAGKEKLPENADTIEIDRIQYRRPKTRDFEVGQREEKPVLEFDKRFYFKPGINILGGVSGAGKSTLYKLMRHFDDLSAGSISVGNMVGSDFVGKKLTELSLEDACKSIGYSFSNLPNLEALTGVELIKKSNPNLTDTQLTQLSQMFGDLPLWEDKGHTQEKKLSRMSDGERDRTFVLSALVSPRKILVLDEPTKGLDPENAERVLKQINNLAREKTIIYTSHNPNELFSLNVSNIIDLERKTAKDGTPLPTNVKTDWFEKGKEAYIAHCFKREPDLSDEKIEQTSPISETEKDITTILGQVTPEPQAEPGPHLNKYLRDTLRSEHAVNVMHQHEIIRKGAFSGKRSMIQKMLDLGTLGSIRRRTNPQKHKRIYHALHGSDR
ncbi:MAG: ATP-binding cassette domain-containing protein [Pseudomonadota bacterium]|nr:ATP-binding cassette domain-containing protein [Pseudomonadota bacterium]